MRVRTAPLVLALLLAAAPAAAARKLVEGIAAQVGSQIVLVSEVMAASSDMEARARAAGATDAEIARIRAEVLDRLIERALIRQVVKRAELTATDAEVDDAISAIASENKISVDQLKKSVEAQGLTFANYREKIRDEIENRKVMNGMVASRVRVSEAQLHQLYEEKLGKQPTSGDEFFLRHILVTTSKQKPAAQACAEAEAARKRVEAGESFESVARQVSESNPKGGGAMGWIHQSELAGWMKKQVEGLQKGGMTPVIQAPFGCNVIQLVDRRPFKRISFKEARPTLYQKLFNDQMEVEYTKFIDELRSKTYIERKDVFSDLSTPLPDVTSQGDTLGEGALAP